MTKIIADQPTDATSDAPGPGFLPLRGLADILTVLLALVVAFICVRLAIRLLSPGSVHYFTDFRLDKAADIMMLGLSILFVVWFYRQDQRRTARLPAAARTWLGLLGLDCPHRQPLVPVPDHG